MGGNNSSGERRHIQWTGAARVVGLFGDPVVHSLSPVMHNEAFRTLGLDWMYAPFHVTDAALPAAVESLRALQLRGVNVTIPHKTAVMPLLDELTLRAQAAGAVNTIVNEDGRLVGDNTDGVGFVRSLREEADFAPAGANVLLLGAGGAAKAIAVALADAGVGRIVIANRTVERAETLARHVQKQGIDAAGIGLDGPLLREVLAESRLFVQTTPAGMTSADAASENGSKDEAESEGTPPRLPEPLQAEWLHAGLVVADIVYTPLHTPLVKAALRRNCTIAPGWGMLLYQGVEALERWTGQKAPVAAMRRVLKKALGDHT